MNNTRQICEGWTVETITATLSFVNLSVAEADIRFDLKNNKELQNLR